jgi:hypothetical protein
VTRNAPRHDGEEAANEGGRVVALGQTRRRRGRWRRERRGGGESVTRFELGRRDAAITTMRVAAPRRVNRFPILRDVVSIAHAY